MRLEAPPKTTFEFERCRPARDQARSFSDNKNPFVDLHLDFPVRFGRYVMGETPFMMAMSEIRKNSTSHEEAQEKIDFHNLRLYQLNHFHDRYDEIKSIIRLYAGNNKQLFKKRVADLLDRDLGPSIKPQDLNAALYQFLTHTFLPFVHLEEVTALVEGFSQMTVSAAGQPFDELIRHIVDSGFLGTLQKDCLKLYPEIYSAELPMRPALYLDLIDSYEKAKTAARISTKDFQSYKDLYKDIAEVLGRQLVLVAGINNVIKRGDRNAFLPVSGNALSSLEKYSEKTLSEKFKYLDDCWYAIDQSDIDAGVRNAIAHNNVDYDEVTQVIRYFPKGGGILGGLGEQIYFLDFMRMLLLIFREMNNLHHLVKCLFYYEYLILQKGKA